MSYRGILAYASAYREQNDPGANDWPESAIHRTQRPHAEPVPSPNS